MGRAVAALAVLLFLAQTASAERPELAEHRTSAEELQRLSERRAETGAALSRHRQRTVEHERRRADQNADKLEGYLSKLLKEGKDPSTDPEARWALEHLGKESAYARGALRLLDREASLAAPRLSRLGPEASPSERRAALRGDVARLTAYVVKADALGMDASREKAALEERRGELIRLGGLHAPLPRASETAAVPEDLRDGLAAAPRESPVGRPVSDYKPKAGFQERSVPEPRRRLPVPTVEPSLLRTVHEAMYGSTPVGPGASRWSTIVDKYAREYNVPPRLILAVIQAESEGNPRSTSPVGARGLMQLMPATARGLGFSPSQLYDPDTNIHAGVKYLSQLLSRYHGDTRLAVAAYNAGEGAVDRYGGVPPYRETRAYVQKVLSNYA